MDPDRDGLDYASAVPLLAPAGACSFHHVRAVHGSAVNRSTRSRNLLLYEFAAADAFPLLGIPDWDDFNDRLLSAHPPSCPACRLSGPHAASRRRARIDLREPDALANRYSNGPTYRRRLRKSA
jgi:hypothetical protein